TQFFIAPSGMVTNATAAGVDPDVAACVADVIKGIEFPKPRGGGGVVVNYPFTFRPAGDDDAGAGGAGVGGGRGAGGGTGAGARRSGAGSATGSGAGSAAGSGAGSAAPPAHHYEPGATNPLRDQDHALVECFRATKRASGVIVVDLAYDDAGGVTSATEHGIDD